MEDSSWRVPTKMSTSILPKFFRRKSIDHIPSKTLDAHDFDDVFGGPPRRVLRDRNISGVDFSGSSSFYHDIFVNPELLNPVSSGRRLPELRIPGTGGRRSSAEFQGNVFGQEMWKSASGSKNMDNSKTMSNSASVLSYDNCSPFRPPVSDDDDDHDDGDVFSVLASKLRSKYVPDKVNARSVMHDVQETQDSVSKFSSTQPSLVEKQLFGSGKTESFKSTDFGFSQRVTSPEIISQGPYSYGSAKLSVDDLDLNSPSSVRSPFFQEQEAKAGEIQDKFLQEEEDDDDDDDEVMRSYVIEINSDHKEDTAESQDLEEAIAWAKEKFQSHSSPEDQSLKQKERGLNVEQNEKEVSDGSPVALHNLDVQIDGCGSFHLTEKKMALLEEDIRLWSSGKEKNIQLLLATLDYILCPSSGWYPVQLTNLNTRANVKKAYQKARLCLHPDKMQQRGANFAQKYVAEKAFPILLDAWAAFISQDSMPSTRR